MLGGDPSTPTCKLKAFLEEKVDMDIFILNSILTRVSMRGLDSGNSADVRVSRNSVRSPGSYKLCQSTLEKWLLK